jgi:ribosomal protein L40E
MTLYATLTADELRSLCSRTGIEPGARSAIAPGPDEVLSNETAGQLEAAGWLDSGALTDAATSALTSLLDPRTRISFAAGTGSSFFSGASYGIGDPSEQPPLVSYIDNGGWVRLAYPQPIGDITDLLLERFDMGLVRSAFPIDATLDGAAYLALMAVLDWHQDAELRSVLDREYWSASDFTAGHAWEMLLEGRSAGNLNWMVSVTPLIDPLIGLDVDRSAFDKGLHTLEEHGLVTRVDAERYIASEALRTLSQDLAPAVAFASLQIDRFVAPHQVIRTRFAVRHGTGAILLEEPDAASGAARRIRGIDSTQLTNLLLNALTTRVCPTCLAKNPPAALRCSSCAGELLPDRAPEPSPEAGVPASRMADPPSRTCPQCGTRTRSTASFCTSCGASLKE